MSKPFTVRPDETMDQALAFLLQESPVTSRNEIIKQAVVALAQRRRAAGLRREAIRLTADNADRAEARQVLAEMEALRAW